MTVVLDNKLHCLEILQGQIFLKQKSQYRQTFSGRCIALVFTKLLFKPFFFLKL